MKIVVVGTRGFPDVLGGVETHCQNLYPLLASQGLDITVFCRSPYVPFEESLYKGVKLKAVWTPKLKFIEAIVHTFFVAFYCLKIKPSVVHLHSIGPGLLVPLFKIFGMKVVFTHHGPDYERGKWGGGAKLILKLGEYCAVKYSDEVIVISNVIKDSVLEYCEEKKVSLIYNGVNAFDSSVVNSDLYLAKHALTNKKYIVAVGRFVEEKGFHDLLSCFNRGLKNNKDYTLVIIGDSDHATKYSESLRAMASGIDNVILTGFLKGDELKVIFSNASFFVMPSYHEGLPIALLEAMSYSLPVLVSDIKPNLEVGLHPDYYFSVGNVEHLTDKIMQAMLRDSCSVDYSSLLGKYNWDDISREVYAVYCKAIL